MTAGEPAGTVRVDDGGAIDLDEQERTIEILRTTRRVLADLKERGLNVSSAKKEFDHARPALLRNDFTAARRHAKRAKKLATRALRAAKTAKRTASRAIATVDAMMEKAAAAGFDTKRIQSHYQAAKRAYDAERFGEAIDYCTKVRDALYDEQTYRSLLKAVKAVRRHFDALAGNDFELEDAASRIETAKAMIRNGARGDALDQLRTVAAMLDDLEYRAAVANGESQKHLVNFKLGRLTVPYPAAAERGTGGEERERKRKRERDRGTLTAGHGSKQRTATGTGPGTGREAEQLEEELQQHAETGLIEGYTFETFVVGESNRLCYTIGLELAANPGAKYNPFYVYGGVGIGKTHLLNAIGNAAEMNDPTHEILYTTAERFASEFVNARREGSLESFQTEYRTLDLVLIDDFQFFPPDQEIIDEFYHTFNSLYNANKQLVIAADRTAEELHWLGPKLISRFKSGLLTTIKPPGFEVRKKILAQEANELKHSFPDEVLRYIARLVTSNIRELKGALRRVAAQAFVADTKISTALVQDALEDFIQMEAAFSADTLPAGGSEIGAPEQARETGDASDAGDVGDAPRQHAAMDHIYEATPSRAARPKEDAGASTTRFPSTTSTSIYEPMIYERPRDADEIVTEPIFSRERAPGAGMEPRWDGLGAARDDDDDGEAIGSDLDTDIDLDIDSDIQRQMEREMEMDTKRTTPTLKAGGSYLVCEERARFAYRLYQEQLAELDRGLILTREHPRLLCARCELSDRPAQKIVWVTDKISNEPTLAPEVEAVGERLTDFFVRNEPGVCIFDALAPLLDAVGFEPAIHWLRRTVDIVEKSEVRFIVALDLSQLPRRRLDILKHEFEVVTATV